MFCDSDSANLNTFQNAKYYIKIVLKQLLKLVRKTIVEFDFNNTNLVTKLKVEKSYNKTVIGFNFGRHKVFLPLKVILSLILWLW